MCDCYDHKCELCDTTIPMHIGDFAFGRDEVEAWCHRHIPSEHGVQVFVMTKTADFEGGEKYPKGLRFGIRLRKGELTPFDEGVHPNPCEAELEDD